MRRLFLKSIGATATCVALSPFTVRANEAYPTRPVTIVFPFGAGGTVDGMIRSIAEAFTKRFGQSFIVDNRPGAGSAIGAEYVSRAKPDGTTLLWAGWNTLTTNFSLYKSLRFKVEDFSPISTTFSGVIGLAVSNSIPVTNFKELVAYVKKSGGTLEYGSVAIGSSPHLLMQLAAKASGLTFNMVGYKGEAQGVTDVLGGHLPAFAGSISNLIAQHRAGKLRLIATSGPIRIKDYPDVPTFHEAGFPQLDFAYWHGLLAPAGTPAPIIQSLNTALIDAMKEPSVLARLTPDQQPMTSTPEKFRELILRDKTKWGEVIVTNNITAE